MSIVVAFFDRLVRSVDTSRPRSSERVEKAGGARSSPSTSGEVTQRDSARHVAVRDDARRGRRVRTDVSPRERTADAKRRAVARGVAPFPNIPPGYRRGANGGVEVDTRSRRRVVAEAFRPARSAAQR